MSLIIGNLLEPVSFNSVRSVALLNVMWLARVLFYGNLT